MDHFGDNTSATEDMLMFLLILFFGISFILSQCFVIAAFVLTIRALRKRLPIDGLVVFWVFFLPVIFFVFNSSSREYFIRFLVFYSPVLNMVFFLGKRWTDKENINHTSKKNKNGTIGY
jgi:glucan phosphoethanolaminetransferase (alkaline phosphatase superfamily)